MSHADKVVVITGGSRGLGLGMGQAMQRWGLRVALCARTTPALEGALCASVDVTDAAQVSAFAERVIDELGGIDLWIHNAGVLEPIRFVRDLDPDELLQHWRVNVLGVLHGSQAFVRYLRREGRSGTSITVSSGAASKPYAAWGAYCSGKAGAERLTEVLAVEEAEHLRAFSVAPGVVDTAMQATLRGLTEEEFPLVGKFKSLKEQEAFNSPSFVAEWMVRVAFHEEEVARELGVEGLSTSFRLPSMPGGWSPRWGA